jgi:hypothetical protein
MRFRFTVPLVAAVLLVVSVLVGQGASPEGVPPPPPGGRVPAALLAQIEATPVAPPPGGAQQVVIGFYPITVFELAVTSSTFQAALYVWFKWRGDIDPTQTAEFVNAVEDWGLTRQNLLPEPRQLADGSWYQIERVQGSFFQPFSLAQFPLDDQKLTFIVEESDYTSDRLAYVGDTEDSGLGPRLAVPGWNIGSGVLETGTFSYDTAFGEETGAGSVYPMASYTINLSRPSTYFILRFLVPLCIVLMANWTALLMRPRLVETRTALPTTALLTVMFLQQSQSLSRPVLLDQLYVLAYAMIITTLVTVILTSRRVKAGDDHEHPLRERVVLVGQAVVFAIGTALIVIFR